MSRFGRAQLPSDQHDSLRRAVRLEWVTLAFLVTAVVLMYLALGSSQAMKAAWLEDLLSFIPPITFLVAMRLAGRAPSPDHPYGFHRAVGVGHLVAATSLLGMGTFMVWDSATGLVRQEHPPVGTMDVFGHTVWAGWLMIAALAYTAVPPVLLGRAKLPLAEDLHDRVLYADAKMNKADWMTAVGGMAGVLGIGLGLWWADAAAALFISGSILSDGVRNMRTAVTALMDARALTVDGTRRHPLADAVDQRLLEISWVAQGRSRIRDEGHVFHVEAFVVPREGVSLTAGSLDDARRYVADLDWRLEDVVVVPAVELPAEFLPGLDEERRR